MKRKLLSWLLTVSMVLSLIIVLPVTASAFPMGFTGYGWSVYHETGGFTGFIQVPGSSDIVPVGDAVGSGFWMTGADFVGDTLYAVSYADSGTAGTDLYTIDTGTGVYTLVGNTGQAFSGFCYDTMTETAYAVSTDGSASYLYSVNLSTGVSALIGTINSDVIVGIAADTSGHLFGIGLSSDSLVLIDKTTGAATLVGSLGIDINYAQDIAYDRDNGVLYGTLYTTKGSLYSIALSGTATWIRDLGAQVDGFAIAYTDTSYACRINTDKYYGSFADALGQLNSGDTLTLLEDITYSDRIWAGSGYYPSFTMDLNGYKLEISNVEVPVAALEGYTISITDNSASGGGTLVLNTTSDDSAPTGIAASGSGSSVVVGSEVETAITASGNNSKGIYAGDGGSVEIGNGIIRSDACGVSAANASTVKIDGSVDADDFINLGGSVLNRDDYTTPTTLANYYTYTDNENTVWVSIPFAGIGTQSEPYAISTESDLTMLSQISRNGKTFSGKYFKQTQDIELTQNWIPICWVSPYYDQNPSFDGRYDGQGCSISGLTITSGTNWVGLFAVVGAGAVVEDVVLDGVDITAGYYSGALAGENRGTITECTVSGSVTGAGTLGGLVGINKNGLLEDCHSSASVTGTGEMVGGLVGYSFNGSGSAASSIVGCSTSGSVSGREKTGGLVGTLQGGLLSESFAVGSVSGSLRYTGGLVGAIDSANGFIAAVENCYARASVTAPGTSYVGGLAGANWYGTIRNSYAAGTISADGAIEAGGLTGTIYAGSVTQDSYYDADLCGLSDTGKGTPKSSGEMKDLATFSAWSFPDVWTLGEDNGGYPALAWQGFVHESLSDDATLSNLTASGIAFTPAFDSEVTSYAASVENSVSATTISATASEESATVTINEEETSSKDVSLNVGGNTIEVLVTAEDGTTTKTYSITITRAESAGDTGGGSSAPTGKQVTVSTPDGGTAVTGTLTGSGSTAKVSIGAASFKRLADADEGAVVPLPSATVTFDSKAMTAINGAASTGDAVLTVERLASSALTPEQQKRVGDRPVYDFTLTKGGRQISGFGGGHAKISIPYTLQPGENPHQIVIYYLTDDGTLKPVKGHYDADSKCVVFETTHFSAYAVGYEPASFSDVASDAWYKDAVDFIAAREITSGTGGGAFSPDAALTRGQFIVLLMNAYGISPDADPAETANFADAGSTYYTDYLLAAKSLGIVNGVGDNLFAPERAITRQEMFVVLHNALKVLGELPQAFGDKQFSDFGDADQVAVWAQEAMSAMVKGGVISGSNGMLNPAANTSRAEMAQILYKLLSQ